jgi:predicted ArsR family transcriptional regulator
MLRFSWLDTLRRRQMQATRREILDILKRSGEATVHQLARQLGLTSTCVRQHLAVLERESLVTSREARRKLGRPQYIYTLTETAEELFPKSYHLLTGWLLDEIKALNGEAKVRFLLERIGSRWASSIAPRITGSALEERIEQLVDLLNREGHMVEWERVPGGFLIHEYDCRFQRVVQQHPEVCVLEYQMLVQLLGTQVQHLGRSASGLGRCTYSVQAGPGAPSL